jgi:hypothetical protein
MEVILIEKARACLIHEKCHFFERKEEEFENLFEREVNFFLSRRRVEFPHFSLRSSLESTHVKVSE